MRTTINIDEPIVDVCQLQATQQGCTLNKIHKDALQ